MTTLVTLPKLLSGWGFSYNATWYSRRYHYYMEGASRSLCGGLRRSMAAMNGSIPEAKYRCRTCARYKSDKHIWDHERVPVVF